MAPACRKGNVSACAKFPTGRVLLPHRGLADAITPNQSFVAAYAARLLRSDGIVAELRRSISHTKHQSYNVPASSRLVLLSQQVSAIWTIFQDTHIVRFRSCCATFDSVLPRMW